MAQPEWHLLHSSLEKTLLRRNLLPRGVKFLVAVSGGQDSLCLLRLLLDLQSRWSWEIAVAHCDHRWPGDEDIARHVEQVIANWQVPFYLTTAVEPLATNEAAARNWRYQVLTELAQNHHFPYLVTGHTLSDRAETFLYNLIRGSGSRGLGCLPWQRPLSPVLKLVRPLLNLTRDQTRQFCQEHNLPVWEDSANDNLKYARNRIRHQIIPQLKQSFNPRLEIHLAHTSEILQAENEYLEQVTSQYFSKLTQTNPWTLNRHQLAELPLAIQRRVSHLFLSHILPKQPKFEEVEALVNLLSQPNRSRTSSLSGKIYLEVERHLILVVKS